MVQNPEFRGLLTGRTGIDCLCGTSVTRGERWSLVISRMGFDDFVEDDPILDGESLGTIQDFAHVHDGSEGGVVVAVWNGHGGSGYGLTSYTCSPSSTGIQRLWSVFRFPPRRRADSRFTEFDAYQSGELGIREVRQPYERPAPEHVELQSWYVYIDLKTGQEVRARELSWTFLSTAIRRVPEADR